MLLFSLHLARYRVPLACPFRLPCMSLAMHEVTGGDRGQFVSPYD